MTDKTVQDRQCNEHRPRWDVAKEQEKILHVIASYTVVNSRTVVIFAVNAMLAHTAVMCVIWFVLITLCTEPQLTVQVCLEHLIVVFTLNMALVDWWKGSAVMLNIPWTGENG